MLLPHGIRWLSRTLPPGDLIGADIRWSDYLKSVVVVNIRTAGEIRTAILVINIESCPAVSNFIIVSPPLYSFIGGRAVCSSHIHITVTIKVTGVGTPDHRVIIADHVNIPSTPAAVVLKPGYIIIVRRLRQNIHITVTVHICRKRVMTPAQT